MQILKSGYVKGKFYFFFFFPSFAMIFVIALLLYCCGCCGLLSPLLLLLKVFAEMLHRGVKIVGAIETKLLKF